MNKFLFITSLFPPLGGSGVQRQLYYLHFAREFGWEPVVITVKNVVYHEYDEGLLSYIPADIQVERTESLEFGRILWLTNKLFSGKKNTKNSSSKPQVNNKILVIGRLIRDWIFIVDDRVLWIPFAFKRAMRVIKEGEIDVVVARGGPMSNTIAGYLISRAAGKPFVLDLADPWLEYPYTNFPTFFHLWVNKILEKKVIEHAAKITVACPQIKCDLHRKYPKFCDEDIEVVTNGFDSTQFADAPIFSKEKPFVVMHVGTLKWIRRQAFDIFIQALVLLVRENPDLIPYIEFKQVGSFDIDIRNLLESQGLIEYSVLNGYCPHNDAIGQMKSADLLLLPISEEMTNKNGVYVIPGKLFEYIGSGKPILMIGPKTSDAYQIIKDEELGFAFELDQVKEVSKCMESFIRKTLSPVPENKNKKSFQNKTNKYERKVLAGRFFNILDRAFEN